MRPVVVDHVVTTLVFVNDGVFRAAGRHASRPLIPRADDGVGALPGGRGGEGQVGAVRDRVVVARGKQPRPIAEPEQAGVDAALLSARL